jgi:molybdate transport system substrate-binding protein
MEITVALPRHLWFPADMFSETYRSAAAMPCAFATIRTSTIAAIALTTALGAQPAFADEATLAVAANFAEVIEVLAEAFQAETDHTLTISTGSSGQLFAQIINGAPFDVFLSADQRTVAQLEAEGGAAEGTRFTYAIGKLTLWSADETLIGDDGAAFLQANAFRALAIANPDVAPYGLAARQTLEALGLWGMLEPKIVRGENIGQTHAMVSTGNAEAGFVALSYVLSPSNQQPGSRWDVPQEFYEPIRQDAVVTARGAGNEAAAAFVEYLASAPAKAIIEDYGYATE